MRSPLASIIILNYNGLRFLRECLDAVFAQQGVSFEVIFVDNGSSDGSVDFVQSQYAHQIKNQSLVVVRSASNTGFAGGNNLGARRARGKFVVLLNNDTKVHASWLKHLLDAFEDASVAIAGSISYNPTFSAQEKRFFTHKALTATLCGEVVSRRQRDDERNAKVVDAFFVGGFALAYRRSLFPVPFVDAYFAYAEDVYLCWRALLRGYRVVHVPSSRLTHYGEGTKRSSDRINALASFHGAKNALVNLLVFYERKNVLRVMPLYLFTQLVLSLRSPLKIWSRLRAHWWVVSHPQFVLRLRKSVQRSRKISDRELVGMMSYVFYDASSPLVRGEVQRVLVQLSNVLFKWYCVLVGLRTRERMK